MNIYKTAFFGCLALSVAACGQAPTSPSAVVGASELQSGQMLAAKTGAIDICHRGGSAFNLLTISENAWPVHQAHGDGVPSGSVPGSTMVFNVACVATSVAAPAAISASPAALNF